MPAKYDKIGIDYNLTRKADPYLVAQLYKHLNPKTKGIYLDIGCGTGNYTHELQKMGLEFIGIDPSATMLEKAKAKNLKIDWRTGQAENIPLASESIAGIMASLTIHHWSDLQASFKELNRVLANNGTIVIFTSTPKQMKGYWLNHYFPKILADSIVQMPTEENVKSNMRIASFSKIVTEKYTVKSDLKDLFLYSGKYHPALYLNPIVRQGISSFSALANQQEVQNGLEKLKMDINTGKINEIIASYENNLGDYLYIIGRKGTPSTSKLKR